MKRLLIFCVVILLFAGVAMPTVTAGPRYPGDEPGYQCGWYPYYIYKTQCGFIDWKWSCWEQCVDVGVYWDCK